MKKLLLATVATAAMLSWGVAYAEDGTNVEVAVDEIQVPIAVSGSTAAALEDSANGNALLSNNTTTDDDQILSHNDTDVNSNNDFLSNNDTDVNSNNDFMSDNTDNSTHDTDIASNNAFMSNNSDDDTFTVDDHSDDDFMSNNTVTDQSDDDLVDVDGGIVVNANDQSDDDGIDIDGGVTVNANDNSDDDLLDLDLNFNDLAVNASTNTYNYTDNSDDHSISIDVGDVQLNLSALSQVTSGVATQAMNSGGGGSGNPRTATSYTGAISGMSISATKGITQVNLNSGIASQYNNVAINSKVGSE